MPCSLFKVNWLATCFKLVSCLSYLSTLNMKATCSFPTSVDFQRATRCYIPKHITKNNNECAPMRKKEREDEEDVGMKECILDTDS
jgi:hypothetical protein